MKTYLFFPAAAIVASAVFLTQNSADAKPDVVSSASLTVSTSNITSTTATINYTKDKYDYGTRHLYYNPAPAVATQNETTKNASGNQGFFDIKGLTPGTTYNFKIESIDNPGSHEKPYNTTGTFTTAKAPASISPVQGIGMPAASEKASQFDLAGRNAEQAVNHSWKVTRLRK